MVGVKRPYPFFLESPPEAHSESGYDELASCGSGYAAQKGPRNVYTNTRSTLNYQTYMFLELKHQISNVCITFGIVLAWVFCDTLKNFFHASYCRDGPSNSSTPSEQGSNRAMRDDGKLDGDFLTLALPPPNSKHAYAIEDFGCQWPEVLDCN